MQPLLFVPEWLYRLLNSKAVTLYQKNCYSVLYRMLNLWFGNFKPIFQRMLFFISCNIFFFTYGDVSGGVDTRILMFVIIRF